MDIGITVHAADQYLMRVAGSCPSEHSTAEAKAYLESAVSAAVKLDRRTKTGQELWQIADALLVVKQEPSGRRIAVTTLSLHQGNRRPSLSLLNAEMVASHAGEVQALGPPEPVKLTRSERLEELIGPPPVLPMASIEAADEYLATARERLRQLQADGATGKPVRMLEGRIASVNEWRDAQDGHGSEAQLVGPALTLPCDAEVAQEWLRGAGERLGHLYTLKPRTNKVEKALKKLESRVMQVRIFLRKQEPREERT